MSINGLQAWKLTDAYTGEEFNANGKLVSYEGHEIAKSDFVSLTAKLDNHTFYNERKRFQGEYILHNLTLSEFELLRDSLLVVFYPFADNDFNFEANIIFEPFKLNNIDVGDSGKLTIESKQEIDISPLFERLAYALSIVRLYDQGHQPVKGDYGLSIDKMFTYPVITYVPESVNEYITDAEGIYRALEANEYIMGEQESGAVIGTWKIWISTFDAPGFSIQGSTNGSDWVTIQEIRNETSEIKEFTGEANYRYARFFADATVSLVKIRNFSMG